MSGHGSKTKQARCTHDLSSKRGGTGHDTERKRATDVHSRAVKVRKRDNLEHRIKVIK